MPLTLNVLLRWLWLMDTDRIIHDMHSLLLITVSAIIQTRVEPLRDSDDHADRAVRLYSRPNDPTRHTISHQLGDPNIPPQDFQPYPVPTSCILLRYTNTSWILLYGIPRIFSSLLSYCRLFHALQTCDLL